MKNILVFMNQNELAPIGGPMGYNFALKSQLDKMGIDNIHYLDIPVDKFQKYNHVGRGIKGTWYGDFLKAFKDFFKYGKQIYKTKKSPVDLNQYDYIHFHNSVALYQMRKTLSDFKGKIVFTSHSPTVTYKEKISMLTDWERKHMLFFYKKLERCDEYAFKRADYIFFPCPEAEEPYYHSWSKFKDIALQKGKSFRYLLTGTNKRIAKKTRKEVCEQYNIPGDAFIVCYAGRHNQLKGYDLLKKIGKKVLGLIPNAYFLIAGIEDPIKGLNNDRWIEVGWTNDPHSLMAAADIFVLPNRETYFDLIMLEALSLGTIVVASNTGGNKHFVNDKGVFLYDDISKAVDIILNIWKMSPKEKNELNESNKKVFENQYDIAVFANNYVKLLQNLD